MEDKKCCSRGNLIFLFVTALLIGVIAKKVASNNIRVGYNDPSTVITHGTLYDIDVLEQELIQKGLPQSVEEGEE